MEKLTSELCGTVNHRLCPNLPTGGYLVTAMPEGMFTNCEFFEYFHERYFKGWFTLEDAANFLKSKGLNLFVIIDSLPNKINYITSIPFERAKGICLYSGGSFFARRI